MSEQEGKREDQMRFSDEDLNIGVPKIDHGVDNDGSSKSSLIEDEILADEDIEDSLEDIKSTEEVTEDSEIDSKMEVLAEILDRAESAVIRREKEKGGSGNLREILAHLMSGSKNRQDLEIFDPQKNKNLVEKSSIIRHLVLKRFPDSADRKNLIEAYLSTYLPELQKNLAEEFDIKDKLEKKGGRYTGPYFDYSYKYKTVQNLVLYLEALEERIALEKQMEEEAKKHEVWRKKTIEEIRMERARHGRKLDESFFSEEIDYEFNGLKRSTPLPRFAKRVGELLITDQKRGLSSSEKRGLDFGLTKLRKKIKALFPDKDDQKLLLEEWIARDLKARDELRELERQYLATEPTEKEKNEINRKIDEIQGFIEPILAALRNAT